jgi:hypothetical protein
MGREVAQDRRARGSWEFVAIVQGKLLLADHSIGRPKWGVENLFDGERVLVRGTAGQALLTMIGAESAPGSMAGYR